MPFRMFRTFNTHFLTAGKRRMVALWREGSRGGLNGFAWALCRISPVCPDRVRSALGRSSEPSLLGHISHPPNPAARDA
jgi:hypothetical protein